MINVSESAYIYILFLSCIIYSWNICESERRDVHGIISQFCHYLVVPVMLCNTCSLPSHRIYILFLKKKFNNDESPRRLLEDHFHK